MEAWSRLDLKNLITVENIELVWNFRGQTFVLNLSLFGAFGVGSLVAFRIVFDFWRSFKYLIQIRTFRLFSKCSKFSRRYTWHNVSAINNDFFSKDLWSFILQEANYFWTSSVAWSNITIAMTFGNFVTFLRWSMIPVVSYVWCNFVIIKCATVKFNNNSILTIITN